MLFANNKEQVPYDIQIFLWGCRCDTSVFSIVSEISEIHTFPKDIAGMSVDYYYFACLVPIIHTLKQIVCLYLFFMVNLHILRTNWKSPRTILLAVLFKPPSGPCRMQNSSVRQVCCYRADARPFLRGLPGAIPVTSWGVNLLEDSYQPHVMFAFTSQRCGLPHSHLNTQLSSTLEGHFYLNL